MLWGTESLQHDWRQLVTHSAACCAAQDADAAAREASELKANHTSLKSQHDALKGTAMQQLESLTQQHAQLRCVGRP